MNLIKIKTSFHNLLIASILMIGTISCSVDKAENNPYTHLYEELPFEMPVLEKPVFPDNTATITTYGAIPDGKTINTEAFEKAIATLSDKGGGTLIVPEGIWYTGPITFRSNINLHLEKGALILFASDIELYPLVATNYEGRETHRSQSPISGRNLENIAITGEGAINGSGDAWRPLKKMKVTDAHWKSVIQSGGILKEHNYWIPSEKAESTRPVMVSLINCKNVLLEGVLFENSPSWNIHPLMCENLIVENIQVRNPSYAQNGDGLDIESCKNVIVTGCTFDVGDDAICIKSGKDEEGRKRGRPAENIIIDNCRVFKGHGGFVVGSEMSGGVKNISVSNCQFMGTNLGLRFKSARGRGGVVENIYVKNINMFDILHEPLLFDLYYFTQKDEEVPAVDETTPQFREIYIQDIIVRNTNRAMFFNGLPEMNISGIHVENAVITSRLGAELSEAENVSFTNVEVYQEEGPALILNNVKDMHVTQFISTENSARISGTKSENIHLPENIRIETNK